MRTALLLVGFVSLASGFTPCQSCTRDSEGRIKRSSEARAEFKREQPCPATGRSYGARSGYIIDHVIPLACDGDDTPANMQWQTREEARVKDRWERRECGR